VLPDLDGVPADIGGRIETSEPLTHNQGNAATGGIWRVRGPAGTAVLKIARPPGDAPVGSPAWQTSAEPTHWNYWRREVTAYTSGFAARVYAGTGIAPPVLLAERTRADGGVELWLAEATGTPGTSWTPQRLGRFAHQLGAAQARWVGRVPDEPWLSRGWLGQYLCEGPARRLADLDDGCWDHPVAAVWPRRVRAGLRGLWLRHDDVRRAVEAAPRTLCHLDVWPTNLIEDGAGTVLLDWSFVGDGAVGEDPANLIVDSVTDGLMDAALLPAIDTAVTDGYLAGLRDGGWHGSPAAVRRAIMAAGAAKYSWFGPAVLSRAASGERYGHSQYGQDRGAEQALLRLRGLMTMLVDWAERS